MRIGVVTHYMPPHSGGIERVAAGLCAAYEHRGHQVEWVASRVPSEAPAREPGRRRVAAFNGPERWLGIPVPIWGPAAWREVAALVAWADVLHVHDCLYIGSALATALGRRRGVPVLLSQHIGFIDYGSPVINGVESLAYRTLGRAVLARASHVVYATPAAERFVPEVLGGEPRASSAIANGIDLERFHPPAAEERIAIRKALNLVAPGPVLLFVGRLVAKKGIDVLAGLARSMPEASFLVVGDGPLAGQLESLTNLQRLASVAPAEMPRIYRAADALVLPSFGEGLPLAVQEAAASGIPSVISADEPYAETLRGVAGFYGAERRPDAFRDGALRALADPGSGAAARHHAERRWDLTEMEEQYLALLSGLGRPDHA